MISYNLIDKVTIGRVDDYGYPILLTVDIWFNNAGKPRMNSIVEVEGDEFETPIHESIESIAHAVQSYGYDGGEYGFDASQGTEIWDNVYKALRG